METGLLLDSEAPIFRLDTMNYVHERRHESLLTPQYFSTQRFQVR